MLRYHFSYHLSSYILPQYLICGIFPDRAHSNVLVAFWLTSHSRLTKSLILMRSSLLQHPAPQKPRHCLLVAYLSVCSLFVHSTSQKWPQDSFSSVLWYPKEKEALGAPTQATARETAEIWHSASV